MDRDPEQGGHSLRADLPDRPDVRRPAGEAPGHRRRGRAPQARPPADPRQRGRALAHAGEGGDGDARDRGAHRRDPERAQLRRDADRETQTRRSRLMKRKLFTAALALAASSAFAQYPNKPITSVVGFAPGGGTDTVSRIVAKTLGEQLGQQVLTDNKAGAGGNIATDIVVRSPADGYTIYLANVGAIAVNPHLLPLQYDPLKDLAPITMAVVFPNLIVVHPSVQASTLAEFIKLARENPGKYTYGSSGIGGAGHLAGELLKMMARIELTHVPFKGGG